jgi:hypothetical protein
MSDRRGPIGVGVAALAFALFAVAAAQAWVGIYSNSFKTKSQYKEIQSVSGKERCDRQYKSGNEVMLITVDEGPKECAYKPPVQGSTSKPDHRFDAEGRILRGTVKGVRDDAFLWIAVRVGGGNRYELQVFPKGSDFKLLRKPNNGPFPVKGNAGAINNIGELNKLRIIVLNDRVRAAINKDEVADLTDPNANGVDGAKVEFGVGTDAKSGKNTEGNFGSLRLSVPDP